MCSLFGVLDYEGRLTVRELHALIRSLAIAAEERGGALGFGGLCDMAKLLKGSFTITTLTRDGLDIVRGNNPLCLWHFLVRHQVKIFGCTVS